MGKHRNLSNEQFRGGPVTTRGRTSIPYPSGGNGGLLIGGALFLGATLTGSYITSKSENEKASKPPVSSASYYDWSQDNDGPPVPGK